MAGSLTHPEDLPGNTVGSLTSAQHAILVGSLLGDGTLRRQNSRRRINALFEVNHSLEYRQYVDWKYAYFRSFVLTPPKARKGNGQRVAYRFTTRSLPVFTNYYQWFYPEGKKRVPSDIELDALSLAVWFMDDGSKSRNAWYLNSQQFSLVEQRQLVALLEATFGIHATLNRDKGYHRIRISTASGDALLCQIGSLVLPCFRYKLTDDPVTTDPKGKSFRRLDCSERES
jgi:hypothetical protein